MIAYRLVQPENVMPTAVSLQKHLESIRQGEIDRVRGRLGRLSPEQEIAIESLTRGIINKVLHPTIRVLETGLAKTTPPISLRWCIVFSISARSASVKVATTRRASTGSSHANP